MAGLTDASSHYTYFSCSNEIFIHYATMLVYLYAYKNKALNWLLCQSIIICCTYYFMVLINKLDDLSQYAVIFWYYHGICCSGVKSMLDTPALALQSKLFFYCTFADRAREGSFITTHSRNRRRAQAGCC